MALRVPRLLAHGDIPGLNDWINGALHPVRSPEHVLLLLALALLLGQAERRRLAVPAIAVTAGGGLGIAAAAWVGLPGIHPAWLLVPAMLAAAAVVFEAPVPAWARAAVAGVGAAAVGLDSAPEVVTGAWKAGLATWLILPVLVVDLAFYASLATPPWARVGLRVLGSWILAVSLLVLAFAWKSAAR